MNKSFKKKAFTLIELLIVIAIIGILFIVLISKVDFATDKAKATGVQTDFRSFQLAFDTVAKEHAGFNTFGWDTGDANQDGIRNSYDEGDNGAGGGIAKNGIQDGTEVFTGHKVYAETFTKVFSLKKNGTGDYDRDALNRLETAINANLDPKLHITIKDDGEIVMANGAKDPWNKEYHGWYITNAETDKQDRGAIIMYSDGANNEFGSEHTIANGIVKVIVPGSNKDGKDDYSIVSVYTYVNGYGEVKNITTGFSNNQSLLGGNESNNIVVNPDNEEDVVNAGVVDNQGNIITSFDQLLSSGVFDISDGLLVKGGLKPDLPPINEYGFYFDVEYKNNDTTIKFHENGSITMNGVVVSEQVFTYSFNKIVPMHGYDDFFPTMLVRCEGLDLVFGNNVLTCRLPGLEFTGENLVLPNDNSITAIDNSLFLNNSNIKSITMSNGITSIGNNAFSGCTNLTKVVLNDNITFIGDAAFSGCVGLTKMEIPSNVTEISSYVFEGCTNLKNITWGEKVTSIGDYAFSGCYFLEDLCFNNNSTIENIGEGAFRQCISLKEVIIPNSIKNVAEYAFYGCTNIKNAVIGKEAVYIGKNVFEACPNIETITIPFVGEIPNETECFFGHIFGAGGMLDNQSYIPETLKTVIITNDLYINDLAFAYCYDKVENIIIQEGTISIENHVFDECTNLKTISIPNSVKSIYSSLYNFSDINYNGTKSQWNAITFGTDWDNSTGNYTIHCTDGDIYKE